MDDKDRRETFWMDVYKLVLEKNIKLHMKDKDITALSRMAAIVADNAVTDFRETETFK